MMLLTLSIVQGIFDIYDNSEIDSCHLKMGVELTPEALHISGTLQTMVSVQYKICTTGRGSWTNMSHFSSPLFMWKINS
jgi:hypothetical protein